MTSKIVQVSEIKVSNDQPMTLFGGINVFESRDMAMRVSEASRLSLVETFAD